MKGMFRTGATTLAILAPVMLGACSTAAPIATPKPSLVDNIPAASSSPMRTPSPIKPRIFTLDTPVKRIAADPQGKAVLDRDIPGLMANKNYPMFDDLSLSEIASMSGGRLTKTRLELVKSDLTQISCLTPAN